MAHSSSHKPSLAKLTPRKRQASRSPASRAPGHPGLRLALIAEFGTSFHGPHMYGRIWRATRVALGCHDVFVSGPVTYLPGSWNLPLLARRVRQVLKEV